MDETFDVPDSTDWLGTPLAGLVPVEQAFRCHVCKDFYNSPMLTSCNHTFCSICIRRCLSVDGKCPLCRATDQESKLRGNWALREAVDAFVQSRDAILLFARTPAVAPQPSSPKRKAAEIEDIDEGIQGGKRLRMSTRSSKTRAAEATAAMARDEADIPEDDDIGDFEPDGLVECPICLARMKAVLVDRHIDTSCPGSPQPQMPSSSSSTSRPSGFSSSAFQAPPPPPPPAKPPQRLPTISYKEYKDNALRKKMLDLGLSAGGSRQVLERRHHEWRTIWNANCDSARPKKRSELLQDLEIWERTMGTRAPTMSRAVQIGQQIKDKGFDGAAWAAKHDTSFRDLIANARKTKSQAEKKSREATEEKEDDEPKDSLPDRGKGVVDLTGEHELPPSSQPEAPEAEADDAYLKWKRDAERMNDDSMNHLKAGRLGGMEGNYSG